MSRDRTTRRLALRIGVERHRSRDPADPGAPARRRGRGPCLFTPRELAQMASVDPDPAVQDTAADAAAAADDPEETLGPLLAARTGRVRAAGGTALRRAGRHAEAEPYLYDRSGTVRACARWVLRQDGVDPLALYRAACADPATMPDRAPLGIAECGERAVDLPVLWALTGHPRPLARSSAVAGLRAFEVTDFPRLLALLDDPAPGVVREAARTLAPWADRLPEHELLGRTGPGRLPHVRIRALRLLRDHGSWAYEETVRRLSGDADPVVRYQARRALGPRG
ncbi:hypothetical protein AB4225_28060 [Streptomyces sp. 2RAF24]|uniref:hypothetical protein n=1 Tax=Streptomyces sp. 2RAF24 TaxID=3232997 RepID=UPI003F95383B